MLTPDEHRAGVDLPHEPGLTIVSSPNRAKRVAAVEFVCVHWTGGDYRSAVDWCCDPKSAVSYHEIIAANGDVTQLVPFGFSAWACGVCKNPEPARFNWRFPNSASDNIALAGGPPVPPTPEQHTQLIKRLVERFNAHGWTAADAWRVLGHCDIAVYPDDYAVKALRGKYGRKQDPWTSHWLIPAQVRADLAEALA